MSLRFLTARNLHLGMALTWAAYSVLWIASYFTTDIPAGLFSVKALVGVSLLTAMEGSFAATHAVAAQSPSPSTS